MYIPTEEKSRTQLNANDFDDFTTAKLLCSSQTCQFTEW
jgi:hypothetical protein